MRWSVGWLVGLTADLLLVLQVSFSILLAVWEIEWNISSALLRSRKSCLVCGLHGENKLVFHYFYSLKCSYWKVNSCLHLSEKFIDIEQIKCLWLLLFFSGIQYKICERFFSFFCSIASAVCLRVPKFSCFQSLKSRCTNVHVRHLNIKPHFLKCC